MKLLVSKFSLAVAVILGSAAFDAAAGIITFDFSSKGTNATSLSFASGGVTISLTNPTGNGAYTGFQTDSDGLFVSNAGAAFNLGALTGMKISFSTAAKITSYSVGYTQTLTAASFNLTGGRTGAASSLNNTLLTAGSYNLSSDYILDANQPGTFAASITGGSTRLTQLKTLTIDTNVSPAAVPELDALGSTGAVALMGFGLALADERRRRRALQA